MQYDTDIGREAHPADVRGEDNHHQTFLQTPSSPAALEHEVTVRISQPSSPVPAANAAQQTNPSPGVTTKQHGLLASKLTVHRASAEGSLRKGKNRSKHRSVGAVALKALINPRGAGTSKELERPKSVPHRYPSSDNRSNPNNGSFRNLPFWFDPFPRPPAWYATQIAAKLQDDLAKSLEGITSKEPKEVEARQTEEVANTAATALNPRAVTFHFLPPEAGSKSTGSRQISPQRSTKQKDNRQHRAQKRKEKKKAQIRAQTAALSPSDGPESTRNELDEEGSNSPLDAA
jgi:hypothetical protein